MYNLLNLYISCIVDDGRTFTYFETINTNILAQLTEIRLSGIHIFRTLILLDNYSLQLLTMYERCGVFDLCHSITAFLKFYLCYLND